LRLTVLLLLGALAWGYDGKYAADARFEAARTKIPALRDKALRRIAAVLEQKVPEKFQVTFVDAGEDRSGRWAQVHTRRGRQVLELRTEYLVIGAYDVEKTLAHELYHCLQRERLGVKAHLQVPKWAREGAAMYVAGQFDSRTRALAAFAGADRTRGAPMERLVNGLGGYHSLEDYAEDVCAFEAAERRHGRKKTVALLRRLLQTPDVERAVRETLGESFADFERAARIRAREVLLPLLQNGRREILEAQRLLDEGKPADALPLLREQGAYAPAASYLRGVALHRLGRHEDALKAVRDGFLTRYRHGTTLLDDALVLELHVLKSLKSPNFRAALARARLDLQPFPVHAKLKELE